MITTTSLAGEGYGKHNIVGGGKSPNLPEEWDHLKQQMNKL